MKSPEMHETILHPKTTGQFIDHIRHKIAPRLHDGRYLVLTDSVLFKKPYQLNILQQGTGGPILTSAPEMKIVKGRVVMELTMHYVPEDLVELRAIADFKWSNCKNESFDTIE